jgi:hypothetical protein
MAELERTKTIILTIPWTMPHKKYAMSSWS